jgi:uncharacterized protein (TIGR01777 family)
MKMEKMKVLISGASGLIGSSLARSLTAGGATVHKLVRRQPASDLEVALPPLGQGQRFEEFTAVVHLSGANVGAHRWTPAYQREIAESRIQPTRELAHLLASLKHPPQAFLCASAIGIYGNRGDELLTEDAAPGTGFLAETCTAWEAAAQPARGTGIRTAHLRFGVVLASDGGALAKMLPIFRLGLGGKLGSGRQWMSWVTLEDVVRAVLFVLENEALSGPINVVTPEPVTNAEFTRSLARTLHRPALLPAPAFALRLALGRMADEALLASARVLPQKLQQTGFRFEHPQLEDALSATLKKE